MKKLLIIVTLLLAGCSIAPPARPTWPDAPAELTQPAPDLVPLSSSQHNLSDILDNVNDNASQYYQLRDKYNGWINWYDTQKQIYNKSE